MSRPVFLLVASALLVAVAAQDPVLAGAGAVVDPTAAASPAPGEVQAQTYGTTRWVSATASSATVANGATYNVPVACNNPLTEEVVSCTCSTSASKVALRSALPGKASGSSYNRQYSACTCTFFNTGTTSVTASFTAWVYCSAALFY